VLSHQVSISEVKVHKGSMGVIFERMAYGENNIVRVQEFV